MRWIIGGIAVLTIGLFYGCVSTPPKNVNNLCKLFKEKPSWYRDVKASAEKWNSTVPIIMSFIYQESRFVHDAKPPRKKILWVIPGPRTSDAYGYAQARDSTWEWYLKDTEQWNANRRDFGDAADFVGWYNHMSHRLSGISTKDTYHLYLAYHDGQGGFNRKTYQSKGWLKQVARKIDQRAKRYDAQLKNCQNDLPGSFWWLPF